MTKNKWTLQDFIKYLEKLIELDVPIHNNPYLRKMLTRDQNLSLNQKVRHATGNVAYKTLDFDIDEVSDEEFWSRIDDNRYNEFIEDNANRAILKMAGRFNLIN